jgi:RNA polymerase sigma-70 factor (ECF subfamily)
MTISAHERAYLLPATFAGDSSHERTSNSAISYPTAIIGTMQFAELSDEDLSARFREATRDEREDCINELFRRNYARVSRWCLRYAYDRDAALDLAQEVFARAYQNLDSFQGESKFSSWLFSIARNHCLNAIRANARQATELKAEVEDDFLSTIVDPGENPEATLDRQSTARQVSQLLTTALDETERVVFTLHYGEELPLDAITQLLGLENASGAKAFIVSSKRKLSRLISQRKVQRP